MKAKQAGILSALLASICCVGPLVLMAIGLGTGAALVGRYHWLFLIGGVGLLTWAWAKYLREKTRCECEHKPMEGRRRGILTLLLATVIVFSFVAVNISRYVLASEPASAETQAPAANGLGRAVISVEGMTCTTCEVAVRHALKLTDGVKSVSVNAASKSAIVEYESGKTNSRQLVAAINSTGYRAALPNETSDSAAMAGKKETNNFQTDVVRASASENTAATTADRISVFEVPLQCPAAPQIGCGSAAKPILLDLERRPAVLEAWLNRSGTTIAIVWKPGSDAESRRNLTAELKGKDATESQGASRDEALKQFSSGKGWYRGAEVDRLSEEEAGIIAARMVRRVESKTTLMKENAEGLTRALTDAFCKKLTGDGAGPDQKQPSLEDVAGTYLDSEQIKILREATEKGVRPLPNEK